jgi:hypothetical protein
LSNPSGRQVLVLDSATQLGRDHHDDVVVTGSHGGVNVARMCASSSVLAVIANDAGTTTNRSGSAVLDYYERIGGAACTVGHRTSRIGDGADTLASGVISGVNGLAAGLGCAVGQPCDVAADLLLDAPVPEVVDDPLVEGRQLLREGPIEVWGLDSASLIRPEDVDSVVVVGSHGGLVGGRAESALRHLPIGALFHDAGIGKESAGTARLAVLARGGVAAATVAAETARIGDPASMWATGRLSAVNETARAKGVREGMTAGEFARHASADTTARHGGTT